MVNLFKFIQRGIRSMLRRKRRNSIQEEDNATEAEHSNEPASDCVSNNDVEMTLAIAAARVANDLLLQNALRPRSIGLVSYQIETTRSVSRFHKPVVCSMPPIGENFKVLRFLNDFQSLSFNMVYSERETSCFQPNKLNFFIVVTYRPKL